MDDIKDRVILIDSISKRYSACGARIGLVASKNKELIAQIMKLCQVRLCVPTLEQLAAANLINTPKEYFDKVKKEYESRRNIMFEKLSEQYNDEINHQSKMIGVVLEPLIIIIIGLVVGIIMISMYAPMFDLSKIIKS